MTKSIIAIDIDDVIADSTESYRLEVNKALGVNLTSEDYKVPHNFYWGYYERVWEMHGLGGKVPVKQLDIAMAIDQSHMPLLPGASFAIGELSKQFELVVITARDINWERATLKWLKSHFGEAISSVHFAGHSRSGANKTKGQLCAELGARWLIDDNPEHCLTAIDAGLGAILFGERGWHHQAPAHLIRCKDWPAVLEYLSNVDR